MNAAVLSPDKLPNDVAALKQYIAGQQQVLEHKDRILEQKDKALEQKDKALTQRNITLEKQERRIQFLEELLRLQKQKRFGVSSEKSTDQREMFNEAELTVEAEAALQTEDESLHQQVPKSAQPGKPRRKPLPAHLPRIRIEHDVPESEKRCPCGCQRVEIGEVTSEQLDIIPAKVQVLVHVRKQYACRHCETGLSTAPLPPQPIPKSNASPGLLAHVTVSKFQDALPLHRQEAVLARAGIELPRNTLASWMIKAGTLVQPLINLLEDHLLAYPVLHCDETPVQVLQVPNKDPTSASYMWVRVGGLPTQPIRLFHYAPSRAGAVAGQLLSGYRGYLQTDDYGGYHAVGGEAGITHLGCWAHARRKFVEAQKAGGKRGVPSKADVAVGLIGKLYVIERQGKDLDPAQRLALRQQEAVPQLRKIRDWLDRTLHTALPKGLLGKALAYLDKNWSKLTVYTEDGRLSIDNNAAENAIRPFVIGRKNWLFSATVPGAKASANLYGLIETAKANGHEPYAYLCHVFKALPLASTVEQVEALLPWHTRPGLIKGN